MLALDHSLTTWPVAAGHRLLGSCMGQALAAAWWGVGGHGVPRRAHDAGGCLSPGRLGRNGVLRSCSRGRPLCARSHPFCVKLLALCKEEIRRSRDVQKLRCSVAV